MPDYYVSPVVGAISEDVYEIISYSYKRFLEEYRHLTGVGRVVIPAILRVERFRPGVRKGSELFGYLVDYGFSKAVSLSVIKVFAQNDILIDELLDRGYDEDSASYLLGYNERLRELGLSISVTSKYALTSDINVRPIREKFFPPPEYELWRSFELSMLIDCTTRTNDRLVERKIEFRGIFTAKKSSIINWGKFSESRSRTVTKDMLGEAALAAENILREYAEIKDYGFLLGCSDLEFNGLDTLEDRDDIEVPVDESDEYVTRALLSVEDMDYDRTAFDDEAEYMGEWWINKKYYLDELREQVFSVRGQIGQRRS